MSTPSSPPSPSSGPSSAPSFAARSAPPPPSPIPSGDRTRLVFGLMVGVALHAFHGTAIVTALPVIADDLGDRTLYGATLSGYLIASIVGLAASAGPVARRGPRPVLRVGLALFGVGIAMSAAAPSMGALVIARTVEGIGGGVITTVLYAGVNLAFPAPERPRILAWMAAAWVAPTLGAPPLAAWIAESIGWPWVFLAVLPFVPLTAWFADGPLGRLGRRADPTPGRGVATADALALAAGCALLLVAGAVVGPADPARLVGWALGLGGLLIAFVAMDRVLPRGTRALRPGLPSAIGSKTLLALGFFGVEGFLPLATTERLGWSTLEAGLLLTGAGVTWTCGSFAQARLAGGVASRGAMLGAAITLAGVAAEVAALREGLAMPWLYAAWWGAAFGMGVGYNVANATAMALTPAGHEGATSSALGISDALGIAVGTGLGGLVIAAGEGAGRSLAASLDAHFLAMAVATAGALLAARRMTAREDGNAARFPYFARRSRAGVPPP